MNSLEEDFYRFLGFIIGVKSNSSFILEHLRSVYSRYLYDHSKIVHDKRNPPQIYSIEIIDDISNSNQLFVQDPFDSFKLRCESLHALDSNLFSHTVDFDPLGFIRGIVLRTVTLLAKNHLMIHAGAVSWKSKGMFFPATNGMGKTTLTVKLVKNGFKFLSDEVACLNLSSNTLEPFFRKISLTDESCILLGLDLSNFSHIRREGSDGTKWIFDIEDIVPHALSDPAIPQYVIFLKGFGEKSRLERISNTHALFQLFYFSISPITDPGLQLFTYAPLFNKVQCFNLVIGNLDEAADLIINLVGQGKSYNG